MSTVILVTLIHGPPNRITGLSSSSGRSLYSTFATGTQIDILDENILA
jgi:hypothetical protein